MWDIFNWNGKKRKPVKKKKQVVKKVEGGKQKKYNKLSERRSEGKTNPNIDKKRKSNLVKKDKLNSIDRLRKEFEEKKRVIEAIEKKIGKKENTSLSKSKVTTPKPKSVQPEKEVVSKPVEKITKKSIVITKTNPVENKEKTTKNPVEISINPDVSSIDFKPVFKVIEDNMEEGFLGGLVVERKNHQVIFAHNMNADDTSNMSELLSNIEVALHKSSFPSLNKFYMLDLEKNFLMLNLLFEEYIYYLVFNKTQTNLGLILNILYDKLKMKHLEIINH